MKYGVTIDAKNTLTEWGLILLANVKAEAPTPRTKYIAVPEMDGALDLTEALTGRVSYNQRRVTFELYAPLEENAFENARSALAAYANGRRVKLWLPDDLEHYFFGRMAIGGRGSFHSGRIAVSMVADPWKYKNAVTTKTVTAAGDVTLPNEGMPTVPTIKATKAGVTVTLGSVTHSLAVGNNRFEDMVLQEGDNTLTVANMSGKLTITYQEGRM